MTSLATAVGGMKHWDWCPICRGGLDTGLECDQCGADLMPIYKAFKDHQARPTDSAVLRAIKARADRSRLGYGGKAWVTSDPKSEVVEDRMILIEIVCRQELAINRLCAALNEAADSFKNAGLSVDAEDCERVIEESLSGGNPGEPKACTGAEERGISGATGAGQHPDGNPESTGDSADRRSPDGTDRTPSPDESNRHFERGCHIIMELMQAYERRVRSDCTTQEQIDKRPWECAEYIKAAEYLRKVWPPHEPLPAPPCVWPDGCRLAGVCAKDNCCHGRQQVYASRPKFANVTCSQCGQEFGPGDHGFSHCRNHEHLKPVPWNAQTKGETP